VKQHSGFIPPRQRLARIHWKLGEKIQSEIYLKSYKSSVDWNRNDEFAAIDQTKTQPSEKINNKKIYIYRSERKRPNQQFLKKYVNKTVFEHIFFANRSRNEESDMAAAILSWHFRNKTRKLRKFSPPATMPGPSRAPRPGWRCELRCWGHGRTSRQACCAKLQQVPTGPEEERVLRAIEKA